MRNIFEKYKLENFILFLISMANIKRQKAKSFPHSLLKSPFRLFNENIYENKISGARAILLDRIRRFGTSPSISLHRESPKSCSELQSIYLRISKQHLYTMLKYIHFLRQIYADLFICLKWKTVCFHTLHTCSSENRPRNQKITISRIYIFIVLFPSSKARRL